MYYDWEIYVKCFREGEVGDLVVNLRIYFSTKYAAAELLFFLIQKETQP